MLAEVDWSQLIVEPVSEMLRNILGYLPKLLGALIILIVGWVLAKIIRGLVDKLLKIVQFDKLADKAGIKKILDKGEVKYTAREILSGLVYWLVIIIVLVMFINALGLPQASRIFESLFEYIPSVISALFVLIIGMFLATFVSGIVRTTAANTGMPKPEMLAGVSRWAIIVFAIMISLEELRIAPLLVSSTFNILFGGVCLGLALAFGIGGKDAAAKYIEELKKKMSQNNK